VNAWIAKDSPRSIQLTRDKKANITIVYGKGIKQSAELLARKLEKLCVSKIPAIRDYEIIKSGTWQIKDEWLKKNLILLGDIYNNQAILCLGGKRLVGCNSKYPGKGKYELKVLFSPLEINADIIVIGATDKEGLTAGINRFLKIVEKRSAQTLISVPPVIETGRTTGPDKAKPWKGTSGKYKFPNAVAAFYWYGKEKAAEDARKFLLEDMALRKKNSEGLWGYDKAGHYSWESHFSALRCFAASGYLAEAELKQVNELLVPIITRNKDWYGEYAVNPKTAFNTGLNRHSLSGLASLYILDDYLVNTAEFPESVSKAEKDKLRKNLNTMTSHIQSIINAERTRGRAYAGMSEMELMCNMATLYSFFGDGSVLENKIFENMALIYYCSKDNLGYAAGLDTYIDSRPGAQFTLTTGGAGALACALFFKDSQAKWLRENTHYSNYCLAIRYPPGMFEASEDVKAEYPQNYNGLCIVPTEPYIFKNKYKIQEKTVRFAPYKGEYEDSFTMAAFRDGFSPDQAYLLLLGQNSGNVFGKSNIGFQSNAIARYTELDSLLLFQNCQKSTSWAKSVVSVSCGEQKPQSAASIIDAAFKTPDICGLSSRMEDYGGGRWTRNIIHRRGSYFAVLDDLTAKQDSRYSFVCRWRSYHKGKQVDESRFVAVDGMKGVKLNIVQSAPVKTTVTYEPRDGAIRPTIVQQYKSLAMKPEQHVLFGNILYAENKSHPRYYETRQVNDSSILVKGDSEAHKGIDYIGTGKFKLSPEINGDGKLWFFSNEQLTVSGCREFSINNSLKLQFDRPVNVAISQRTEGNYIESRSMTPIRMNYTVLSGAKVIFKGKILSGTGKFNLEPGTFSFEFGRKLSMLQGVKLRLEELWSKTVSTKMEETEFKPEVTLQAKLQKSSELAEIKPERMLYQNVKAFADPLKGFKGKPGYWVDRRTRWGGAFLSAGWKSGNGSIILDLHKPVDLAGLRLIWPCLRMQGPKKAPGPVLQPEQIDFKVTVSDDNFQNDVRVYDIKSETDIYYVENAHYMGTQRFPAILLNLNAKARYIRITGTKIDSAVKGGFYLDEIQIIMKEREQRAQLKMKAIPNVKKGAVNLLAWSPEELLMMNIKAGIVKNINLESLIVDLQVADIDSDGKMETVIFPLNEMFTAYNQDGSLRFKKDLFKEVGGYELGRSRLRPGGFCAWRPDKTGKLEYAFFPHYLLGRITPEPELKHNVLKNVNICGVGGKRAITIPDITGDGIDDLAIIYTYTMNLKVIASESDLENGKFKSVLNHPLDGYSSGNRELPDYFEGVLVKSTDGKNKWLGLTALNPGGVAYFSAPKLDPVWEHFSHVPNMSVAVWDSNNNGVPDIFVGRKDGYITQYSLKDGKPVKSLFIGHEARAIAPVGKWLAAGSSQGLFLLDDQLNIVDYISKPVDAMAVVGNILAVGFSSGDIVTYRIVKPEEFKKDKPASFWDFIF